MFCFVENNFQPEFVAKEPSIFSYNKEKVGERLLRYRQSTSAINGQWVGFCVENKFKRYVF